MSRRGRYHHGDLRQALLDAALWLAEERGVAAVTLREVARRAGVSHAAPYHHFADKAALLDALVVRSYGALTAAVRAAADSEPGDALARLGAIGVAYVRFALDHHADFHFLYRPGLVNRDAVLKGWASDAGTSTGAQGAYEVLREVITGGQQDGVLAADDPESLVLAFWAAAHGLAVLLGDGVYGEHPPGAAEADALAAKVSATLIAGLGVRSRPPSR